MKTQAELREMCEMMLSNIEHGDRIGTQDIESVAADYLRLTDPTPLTAEHCRAAGMEEYEGGLFYGREQFPIIQVTTLGERSRLHHKLPTSGLLYAAQRQEEAR